MNSGSEPLESVVRTEPSSIDFGDLPAGQGSTTRVVIHGPSGTVSVSNDQLKVRPAVFGEESTLEVEVLAGDAGEIIWDELLVKTRSGQLRVLVTARWVGQPSDATQTSGVGAGGTRATLAMAGDAEDSRTFKGRACLSCRKNFGYDFDTRSWERCTCTPWRRAKNIGLLVVTDLRRGAKDLPSYVQEVWEIVLGKRTP